MAQCALKIYVRAIHLAWAMSLVSGDCIKLDLGMGSELIQDSMITASSELNHSTPARNGRFNYAGGSSWCASANDSSPYLQIDLQSLHIICAVSTQGNSKADEWVETYTIQTSTDSISWTGYEDTGYIKTFLGNIDRNSEEKTILYHGVVTRWLRFLGKTRHSKFCMRVEVFGVKQKPENLALNKPTTQSSRHNSSSGSENAVDGNRNPWFGAEGNCTLTNVSDPSWWQVDLGTNHVPVSELLITNRLFPSTVQVSNGPCRIRLGNDQNWFNNLPCDAFLQLKDFVASSVCYTNPLRTGRYVGIQTVAPSNRNLSLCEVEVYSRENIAYNKVTDQKGQGLEPSRKAVDGDSRNGNRDPPCAQTKSDLSNPWWRVDLGRVEPVNEVYIVSRTGLQLNSLEIRVGPADVDGGITNPVCGSGFSVPEGEGRSFFCRPSLFGQYVTITIPGNSEQLTLCEVEVYSERRACQMQAVGVTSSLAFPDYLFSAKSSSNDNAPSKGRLNGDGAWSPRNNTDPEDYLQINLRDEFFICAVATQGHPKNTNDFRAWTTKYKLLLSLNRTYWITYQENGVDKIFNGNSFRIDIVKHNLARLTRARFIRFQPVEFHNHKALRVEVYGVLKPAGPHGAPTNFNVTVLTSTSMSASWQLTPADSFHGVISGFKVLYKISNSSDPLTVLTIASNSTLTTNITDLEKDTEYEFQVLAFSTLGNGPLSSVSAVRTNADAPIAAPDNVSFSEVTETTFNISWVPLTREKSNGKIAAYEVIREKATNGDRIRRSLDNSKYFNSTKTFIVLRDFQLGCKYNISVRAYTRAGRGPFSKEMILETSKPAPPYLKVKIVGATVLTLTWMNPSLTPEEVSEYTITYSGTKNYLKDFRVNGTSNVVRLTTQYTVPNLVPGTLYTFHFSGTSACGQSLSERIDAETKVADPLAPKVENLMVQSISTTNTVIQLWPAEQMNGPISSYQVIVLEVVDGAEDLPEDYSERLNSVSSDKLNFYIAAEIRNVPVRRTSWAFNVGNETRANGYLNRELQRGKSYIVYERAITRYKTETFEGKASKVATITVTKVSTVGGERKALAVAVSVPVVLITFLLIVVVGAVFFYRKRNQKKSAKGRNMIDLDDISSGPYKSPGGTENVAYENSAETERTAIPGKAIYQSAKKDNTEQRGEDIYQNADVNFPVKALEQVYANIRRKSKGQGLGTMKEISPPKEPLYDETDDGKPKAIPVTKFAEYVKKKSKNRAVILKEEFKNLSGAMLLPWKVAQANKVKNRYGNIVTYDHSRVILKEKEGHPGSDYINASYIPTYDGESMHYIATQGPTNATIKDFWRMIWQENCTAIVMLTNLAEQGKAKCAQYWPNSASKYDDIEVSLQKTENFANYVIRTFLVTKDSEKREVVQFHYTTWPDKGVPHNSTALLAFRWKVYARQQLTEGPIVVHCSAGVGRTGTFIAIDAMLERAKERDSVFIQNYVEVMRNQRPYMVQKEEQYVFLHQAVMVALACGNTEVSPQDLLIRMNKLGRVHKSSEQTGYEEEFQRLQRVSESESQGDESTVAFKPRNMDKNRSPNNVPVDTSRVVLRSSQPDKDYINASFVDGNIQRDAYILTQAPLINTIEDFWRMISQYGAGTVVMLNNLREKSESYPQYWPSEGVTSYGSITLKVLSETRSGKLTIRRFDVTDAEPPKKTSVVRHLQFTGWNDPNSSPDPQEILQLLTAIDKSQQNTGNGIIVLQCSDGVGRSATLAAIMSAIEKIKTEQTVDVFQTIKLIRVKRPGAVVISEQYRFCYETILAYLDSFKTYSNFADC